MSHTKYKCLACGAKAATVEKVNGILTQTCDSCASSRQVERAVAQ